MKNIPTAGFRLSPVLSHVATYASVRDAFAGVTRDAMGRGVRDAAHARSAII